MTLFTGGVTEETSAKDEDESALHWKEMMLNAIGEREETEQEKQVCCLIHKKIFKKVSLLVV